MADEMNGERSIGAQLLPCPFCGSAAHFEMDEGRWEWIECESCGMQSNRGASLMEDCKPVLAETWNRRAPASFTAADMATASAQGFRDGVASLAASAPAATPSGAADGYRDDSWWMGWNAAMRRNANALLASHGQAPAQPTAVPLDEMAELSLLNRLIELGNNAAGAHATANSDDGHKGTAAYVQWQEVRAEMGELIRQAYAVPTPSPQAAQQAPDPGPPSATVEEAARHVGKWLNERPNRPLDLRDVAMLAAHAQQAPAGAADWWRPHASKIEDRVAASGSTAAMACFTDMRTLLQAATEQVAAPAAPSTPASDGWMPIETAPKDGTELLLWREDCGHLIGSYTSADGFPLTQEEIDGMDEETLFAKDWFTQWPQALRLDGSEMPTHWQPLPASPTIEGESNV